MLKSVSQNSNIKLQPSNTEHYWDPAGSSAPVEAAQIEQEKLNLKLEHFSNNPGNARSNLILLCTLAFAAAFVVSRVFPEATIHAFVFGLVPAFVYFFSVQTLEKQLALLAIAKKRGWLYRAKGDNGRWRTLKVIYPEIFAEGDHGQSVSDQFWGTLENTPFWMGHFTYSVQSGDSSTTYLTSTYAFQLPKKRLTDFQLIGHDIGTKIGNLFRHELTTEWNDFNRIFSIHYKNAPGTADDVNVLSALNPIVQEKLVAFWRQCGRYKLSIRGDVFLVLFREAFDAKYTNFFRRVAVDERDLKKIEGRLEEIIQLSVDILPHLD